MTLARLAILRGHMNKLTGKTYGVRFSLEVEALIQEEADRTGQTCTEVIRNATAQQLKGPRLDFLLKQLEIRMLRRNFETNSIIVGLTAEQRQQAMHECNHRFKQEVLK